MTMGVSRTRGRGAAGVPVWKGLFLWVMILSSCYRCRVLSDKSRVVGERRRIDDTQEY